jgi:hypothetical protein
MKLKQKNELRKKALQAKKLEQSKKVDELAKSWNPLPVRGQTLPRINKEFSTNSNFINCAQRCMNKGKYQGIDIKDVPVWYLKWVVDNITLNQSELNLIRKVIK